MATNSTPSISICIPSRGRPIELHRMIDSAIKTASNLHEVEFLVYADLDDESMSNFSHPWTTVHKGKTRTISEMTNYLAAQCNGMLIMYAADDVVFRTAGWDKMVQEEYRKYRICLIHGDDLGQNSDKIATHGFISRELYEILGYVLTEKFKADFCDTWLTYVCTKSNVRIFLKNLTIEHLHPVWGKAPMDATYRSTSRIKFISGFLKFKLHWFNQRKQINLIRRHLAA